MSKKKPDLSRTEKAAEIQATQARRERNRRLALVAGIMVVLGAVVAAGTWAVSGSENSDTADYSGITSVAGDASILLGPATAPVKVVIYEDFLCPYCRELETSTRDFLRENAAKNKVQVEYRPVNILTQSTYSARAMNAWAAVLENAGPAAALKLHNLLFENQPYESNADETSDADILKLVKEAGADNAEVMAALKTQNTAFFNAASTGASQVGLTGTPTVMVNGTKLENLSIDQMVGAIEDAVASGS